MTEKFFKEPIKDEEIDALFAEKIDVPKQEAKEAKKENDADVKESVESFAGITDEEMDKMFNNPVAAEITEKDQEMMDALVEEIKLNYPEGALTEEKMKELVEYEMNKKIKNH